MADEARAGAVRSRESELNARWAGLDALQQKGPRPRRAAAAWAAAWPKLTALMAVLGFWQAVVLTGWRPAYVLPGPVVVLGRLWQDLLHGNLVEAMGTTLRRAGTGFLISILIGAVVGILVVRRHRARLAFGSLITGLQTMPSIAWFPLAVLLFGVTEGAILFVVVLGAAPAIANGLVAGFDQMPPLLLRAGRVLGAQRLTMWRHVILPAILPGFVAGLKQGWAFAWRSLMAGELLVIIAERPSLGVQLSFNRELADSEGLMAVMVMILIIGIVVDALVFGRLEREVLTRRGLLRTKDRPA